MFELKKVEMIIGEVHNLFNMNKLDFGVVIAFFVMINPLNILSVLALGLAIINTIYNIQNGIDNEGSVKAYVKKVVKIRKNG